MPGNKSPIKRGKLKPPTFWDSLLFATCAGAGAVVLLLTAHPYWAIAAGIPAATGFYYLTFDYQKDKTRHEEILQWLATHEPVCIFLYTTKKTFLSISENTIIPLLPQNTLIVKDEQNHVTTPIPASHWRLIRMKTLPEGRPVLIRFEKEHFVVINLKSDCEALRSKAIDEKTFSDRMRSFLEMGVID